MSDQGKEYAAFIAAQLQAESDRRDNINSRAAATVTGASGLVTLVLAVFAILIRKDFVLEGCAKTYLAIALVALLLCAILAVIAGLPWRYGYPTSDFMKSMIDLPHWKDSEVQARNMASYSNLVVIDSLRPGTAIKAHVLIAAQVCQAFAVLALALCTLAVLGICTMPPWHNGTMPPWTVSTVPWVIFLL